MLENAVSEICWVFLVIKVFTSKKQFDSSDFLKASREKSWSVVFRDNSLRPATEHLRRRKNTIWSTFLTTLGSTSRSTNSGGTRCFFYQIWIAVCAVEAKARRQNSKAFQLTLLINTLIILRLWKPLWLIKLFSCDTIVFKSQDSPLAETTLSLNWQTLRGLAVCANVNP